MKAAAAQAATLTTTYQLIANFILLSLALRAFLSPMIGTYL